MRSMHSVSRSLDSGRFLALAAHLARERGADLLLSGPGYPGEKRSIVALDPLAELHIDADTTREQIKTFCFDTSGPNIVPGPTLGYLSYELGMRLRGVATTKPAPLPQGHLKQYAALLIHDAEGETCTITARDAGQARALAQLADTAPHAPAQARPSLPEPVSSLTQERYEQGVRRTLEHILDGQTYQLNLSIRFDQPAPDLDSLALFLDLYSRHPAPFYAWFTSGQQRILSTSPERFLKVTDGQVMSQPVKGTLAYDANLAYDPALEEILRSSPKEQAELSMIVDLIRNDISHHCEYGSVRVEGHQSIFRVDNLLQMYSNVRGELRPGSDCLDLLFDAFPGGSVTGCPKHRAMELIDRLEPHSRGVYCGSFVCIENKQTMDSSICIRTAVHDLDQGRLTFYAGSGIVVDSDPASEYLETMAKAAKFLRGGKR
ncbi:MAG: anthranilate synthase component I family protein [Proteobacteria bacterium]|nr:anthranilate synthase component I family protein [Pseudomonadota bacterium]MBU1612647.1 anthranilate synthase component I family protein [Pseudomonadota bacterium]